MKRKQKQKLKPTKPSKVKTPYDYATESPHAAPVIEAGDKFGVPHVDMQKSTGANAIPPKQVTKEKPLTAKQQAALEKRQIATRAHPYRP